MYPSVNKFDYKIEQDMSCLSDRFTIDLNPLCISVANTHALELQMKLQCMCISNTYTKRIQINGKSI